MGDGSLDSEFLTSGLILDFDYDYYSGLFYTASGDPAVPEWSLTDDFYAWYYGNQMLNGIPEDWNGLSIWSRDKHRRIVLR